MIDLKVLREDPDRVRASQRARGEDADTVDALIAADERRRKAVAVADSLRAAQKALGKQVGQARPSDPERGELLARAKQLAADVKHAEAEQASAEQAIQAAHRAMSNLVLDGVPAGGEDDYVVLKARRYAARAGFRPARPRRAGHRAGVV